MKVIRKGNLIFVEALKIRVEKSNNLAKKGLAAYSLKINRGSDIVHITVFDFLYNMFNLEKTALSFKTGLLEYERTNLWELSVYSKNVIFNITSVEKVSSYVRKILIDSFGVPKGVFDILDYATIVKELALYERSYMYDRDDYKCYKMFFEYRLGNCLGETYAEYIGLSDDFYLNCIPSFSSKRGGDFYGCYRDDNARGGKRPLTTPIEYVTTFYVRDKFLVRALLNPPKLLSQYLYLTHFSDAQVQKYLGGNLIELQEFRLKHYPNSLVKLTNTLDMRTLPVITTNTEFTTILVGAAVAQTNKYLDFYKKVVDLVEQENEDIQEYITSASDFKVNRLANMDFSNKTWSY